jgi:hypothetical protein
MPRDWLLFGMPVFYALVVLLTILTLAHGRPVTDLLANHTVIGWIAGVLQHLPYVERVAGNMETHGLSKALIDAKVQFLTCSYVVMLSGYVLAVLCTSLALVLWGLQDDPYTEMFSIFGRQSRAVFWTFFVILGCGDLFVAWFGIHGFGYFPDRGGYRADYIETSDFAVVRVVFLMAFSLLVTLAMARFSLCCTYGYRHVSEAEQEWPRSGVPQLDEPAEIEEWKPEK